MWYDIDDDEEVLLRACYGVRVEEFSLVVKVGGGDGGGQTTENESVISSPVKKQSTNTSPIKDNSTNASNNNSATTSPKKKNKNKKGKDKQLQAAASTTAELVSTTFFLPLLETLPTLHASKRRICRFAQVPAENVTITDENVMGVYYEILTHRPMGGCVGDGSDEGDGALGGDGGDGSVFGGDGVGIGKDGDGGDGSVFGDGTGGVGKNWGKGKFFKVSYVGEILIDTRELASARSLPSQQVNGASQANGGATNTTGFASSTTVSATGANNTTATASTAIAATAAALPAPTTTLAEEGPSLDLQQAKEESEEMKKYNRIQRIMDMDFGFGWSNPRGSSEQARCERVEKYGRREIGSV